MTFQSYLDNIREKTGKGPDDFKRMAKEKGLTTHAAIVAWLKDDYDLGAGHSRAIAHVILNEGAPKFTSDEAVDNYFGGVKAAWRPAYDQLVAALQKFGPDVKVTAGKTYLSVLRGDKKFGIVQVSGKGIDVGIKLKGAPAEGRFEEAGSWNTMVTHRVRIDDAKQLDAELVGWLKRAYDKA